MKKDTRKKQKTRNEGGNKEKTEKLRRKQGENRKLGMKKDTRRKQKTRNEEGNKEKTEN